jgi:hypothetical protein
MEQNKNENKTIQSPFTQTYFHGTKADLHIGPSSKLALILILGKEKMQNISSLQQLWMLLFGVLNLPLGKTVKAFI